MKIKNTYSGLQILTKIKTIATSRFKKPIEESWIKDRRATCSTCEWNTLNQEKLSLKTRIIKFLSDMYSKITGNADEDVLGNCGHISCGCSIYFKTSELIEKCPENKWKK